MNTALNRKGISQDLLHPAIRWRVHLLRNFNFKIDNIVDFWEI